MAALIEVLAAGLFHAAVLFLVAAGLQLVFGVQRILNLACGSFYALGAYLGVTAGGLALGAGLSPLLALPLLVLAGAAVAALGPPVERLLRLVYDRDESFQLLLTFALVLMFQDLIRMGWGSQPQQVEGVYLAYGQVQLGAARIPVWNLLVLAAAIAIAGGLGLFLQRTDFGRILRATAENRRMAASLGVDTGRVYAAVFTLGTALGGIGGALVVPAAAAVPEKAVELVVEAFAVVVIGGLGSMPGALAGAAIVGLLRAGALLVWPELELLAVYAVVVAVLLLRPAGLFGRPAA
ncbi:branched-chain amino acid ABC transporter permease [Caldovatus aquaticus]|uniref:Branched-chain amino acid ABC transporter permease n=1 Tax=Caldovatus aquaticus TaxID=2865671 RepID=A0ABS7F4B7_9PROT|nr:branched-chain amino acid ABC transporter permease [Caldovatus aquaticus]MBW8269635.1 branched-chain amino acid ABC transporter permease [Caldovatus aquaticus]